MLESMKDHCCERIFMSLSCTDLAEMAQNSQPLAGFSCLTTKEGRGDTISNAMDRIAHDMACSVNLLNYSRA